MTKAEFKKQLLTLLDASVQGLTDDEKPAFLRRAATEFEKIQTWDQSKTRAPWSDDELRLVLRSAPTHENTLRLAKAFRRGYRCRTVREVVDVIADKPFAAGGY